jgi:plasmid stabilization system protein ParE
MSPKVIILPFAELDIKESVNFYKDKSQKTALEFIESFNIAFNLIIDNPKTFPIVKTNIRKFIMKKFPFCIYFIDNIDKIYILAVFHTKRNPYIWEKRNLQEN